MRVIAVAMMCATMMAFSLVFAKNVLADCVPCLKKPGKYHNHPMRRRLRPVPHPLTRLQILAVRRAKASRIALTYIGTPYRWGGASPSGFDCSGLVAFAMAKVGITVPHSSWSLLQMGVPVTRRQVKAGDVLFFGGGGHVALAINNNFYVEAPHTGAVVRLQRLTRALYAARRMT